MKKLPSAFVIAVFFLSLWGLNSWLVAGLWQAPENAIFISNYDNLDKAKTWDQLKGQFPSLDPSRVWGGASQNSKQITLSIEPVDRWDEFFYPKTVIMVRVQIVVEKGIRELRIPTLLILVLDENDRVRGKLYTPAPSPEPSDDRQAYRVEFWFRLPQNMIERRYSIAAELFGKPGLKTTTSGYTGLTEVTTQYYQLDATYGMIPAWDYSRYYSTDAAYYTLLDYARDDNRIAPPSTLNFRSVLADSTLAATLISSVLTGTLLLRKRIVSFAKSSPELTIGIGYVALSVILFVILIAAFVLLR